MKTAGQIILAYLKEKGINQTKLAERMGDTPQNIGNKLRRKNMTCETFQAFCNALNHDFYQDLTYLPTYSNNFSSKCPKTQKAPFARSVSVKMSSDLLTHFLCRPNAKGISNGTH